MGRRRGGGEVEGGRWGDKVSGGKEEEDFIDGRAEWVGGEEAKRRQQRKSADWKSGNRRNLGEAVLRD